MEELSLQRPWSFTAIVVLVWVLLWIGIEVVLFNDGVTGAVLTGAASGLAFAGVYIVLRRRIEK